MSLGIDVPDAGKVVIENRRDVTLFALFVIADEEKRLQSMNECSHASGFCIVLKFPQLSFLSSLGECQKVSLVRNSPATLYS
jgi:hypothetical protein